MIEALGCRTDLDPREIEEAIDETGFGFIYSPPFSRFLKRCESVRKDLQVRTIINLVAPLTNPASPTTRVLGVYSSELSFLMASVLKALGVIHALVVHGTDGLDEITTGCDTEITELRNGQITSYVVNPNQFGISLQPVNEVVVRGPTESASLIKDVFSGQHGTARDLVILNSAAGLYVGGAAPNLEEGAKLARKLIDSGSAMKKLTEVCNRY